MRTLIGILLSVTAIGSVTAAAASSPTQPVTFAGQVVDASTGEPIVGARVLLRDARLAAQTNAEGRFLIRVDLPPGAVEISIVHSCYFTTRLEALAPAEGETGRLDVGLPHNYAKYGNNAPPLGGCEVR